MRKNENGRSMVEMLGVLAIIGVLSVGGIYGYTSAMRKYKANEIVQTASMLATMAHSANGGAGGALKLSDTGISTTPGGVTVYMCANNISDSAATVTVWMNTSDASNLCDVIDNIKPTDAKAGYHISCETEKKTADFTTCNATAAN